MSSVPSARFLPGGRLAGVLVTVLAGALSAWASWRTWILPFVDSSREMNVPARLVAGERLYRDVVYYYGPAGPWINAAAIAAFGRRFASLEVAGLVAAVALFASLAFLSSRAGSRLSAIAACVWAAALADRRAERRILSLPLLVRRAGRVRGSVRRARGSRGGAFGNARCRGRLGTRAGPSRKARDRICGGRVARRRRVSRSGRRAACRNETSDRDSREGRSWRRSGGRSPSRASPGPRSRPKGRWRSFPRRPNGATSIE